MWECLQAQAPGEGRTRDGQLTWAGGVWGSVAGKSVGVWKIAVHGLRAS
jgi:hypothetical protein